jgi:hypothetical protein
MAGEFTEGGGAAPDARRSEAEIQARLNGVAGSPAGGGHFAFYPDELSALVKEWRALAASYNKDIQTADALKTVKGPGADYASAALASVVRSSGESLIASLARERDFCNLQKNKFQQAMNAYLDVDRSEAGDMNSQGPVFGG